MPDYCQLFISATTKKEAEAIGRQLLKRKLIAGYLLLKGPSMFWWKGKITRTIYYNLMAFSLMKNKPKIISAVRKVTNESVPIISFSKIDGNKEFLSWINNSCKA
ncbi:MAG: divalent cation tolerance protein CutA [Candidatus Aenigmarchaeota archaeon]|nr:divalent cation tolerance protein CutA [Candidatus Aenigmarchaeota archaeon]